MIMGNWDSLTRGGQLSISGWSDALIVENIKTYLNYSGKGYRFWQYYTLPKNGTQNLIFKTAEPWTHVLWNIWCDDSCDIRAYIQPVVTSYGPQETFPMVGPINTNVVSATNVELYSNSVVSDPGILVGRWWKDMREAGNAVFIPNLNYLARVINKHNHTIRFNLDVWWHELKPATQN